MFTAPAFSDLVIDRYLAGELSAGEHSAFEARLAAEPMLQARVEELRAGRRAFALAAPDFSAVRAAAAGTSWWIPVIERLQTRFAFAGVGAVALAVVAVVFVPGGGDDTRSKGRRFVDFVVEREGQLLTGAPGLTLYPGDRVQFTVDAGVGSYVGVWSKDGAGAVGAYAPAAGDLERAQGKHRFANSTRLDDVVGDEAFVGVRCDVAVDGAVVAAAVAADVAPEGCAFDRVAVLKRQRP